MSGFSIPLSKQPLYYSTNEGGHLFPWLLDKHGLVTFDHLNLRAPSESGNKYVEINNQPVHSLLFSEPKAMLDKQVRWDCVNGWNTKEPTDDSIQPQK